MSQLNLPSGAANVGAGQVPVAFPGRVIVVVQERRLADGRSTSFAKVTRTWLTPSGQFATVQREIMPATECGCSPLSLHDLYPCLLCGSIVCGRHLFTCPLCGRGACAPCCRPKAVEGAAAVICSSCAQGLRPSLLRRCWAWLRGWW